MVPPQQAIHNYKPAAVVRATGEDAFAFMQSQASQDLRTAEKDDAVYTLWLDHKGKVIGDSYVFRESQESLLIISIFTPAVTLLPHWRRHIVADEVELEDETEKWSAIACAGSQLHSELEELREAGHIKCCAGRRERSPWRECFICGEAEHKALRSVLDAANAERVTTEEMERMRIEAGIPRVPIDIGPADLPAEGGLVAAAVSFSKGCFLGQEVVARMHHVGRPRRVLMRVRGQGRLPSLAVELLDAQTGDVVGELRSRVALDDGAWHGLSMCPLRKVENVVGFLIQNQPATIETIVEQA